MRACSCQRRGGKLKLLNHRREHAHINSDSSASAFVVRLDGDRTIPPLDESEATSNIGEIAREFGLTLRALRFYESRGLISPRYDASVRAYGQSDRDRLLLILKGKKLGFSLEEIRQVLAEPEAGGDSHSFHLSHKRCGEQIEMLERRKRHIETALVELRQSYSESDISTLLNWPPPGPDPPKRPLVCPSMF
jgi:DNA-binding transcriptional MerR regulator